MWRSAVVAMSLGIAAAASAQEPSAIPAERPASGLTAHLGLAPGIGFSSSYSWVAGVFDVGVGWRFAPWLVTEVGFEYALARGTSNDGNTSVGIARMNAMVSFFPAHPLYLSVLGGPSFRSGQEAMTNNPFAELDNTGWGAEGRVGLMFPVATKLGIAVDLRFSVDVFGGVAYRILALGATARFN